MHKEFTTALANFQEDLQEDGATKMLADSMDAMLVNWLFEHIKTIDVAFGKFLQEKGIDIPNEA